MSTRHDLLALLADGAFHSGTALGERLGVSRAAVNKAVQVLVDAGLEIHSVPGRGYRLDEPFTPLSEDAIHPAARDARHRGDDRAPQSRRRDSVPALRRGELHRASECRGGGPRHSPGRTAAGTRCSNHRAGEGGSCQGRRIGRREAQRQWRLSLPMERYVQMRRKFNDAGIEVYIAKFAPSAWSDEEIDYAYTAAKTLGSIGITDELSDQACQRLPKFPEKHKSLAMFHTHGQVADAGFSFDKYLAYSPASMLNLDAGHYYGATGLHPNDVIVKYHDRLRSIHIKDKTGPKHATPNANKPFGQGETADRGHPAPAQEGEMANRGRRGAGGPDRRRASRAGRS